MFLTSKKIVNKLKNLESAEKSATHRDFIHNKDKISNYWGKLFMNGIQEQRNDLENYKV